MSERRALLLGHEERVARALAGALDAELCVLPRDADDRDLEAWRARLATGAAWPRVVIALWLDGAPDPAPLCDLDARRWHERAEAPFLAWSVALGAAAACCADGGSIVAVAEAPAPLDAAGFAPEVGLAQAVSALVRSIAQAEGARGVRANAVTTPTRLASGDVPAPAPPGAAFPGRLEHEVVGAVRLLFSQEASGITGRTLPVDCGRSW